MKKDFEQTEKLTVIDDAPVVDDGKSVEQHESVDERVAPAAAEAARLDPAQTAQPDSADSAPAQPAGSDCASPNRRRTLVFGAVALACVALVALVVGLNFDALAALGDNAALQTTAQDADQTKQADGTQRDASAEDIKDVSDEDAADATSTEDADATTSEGATAPSDSAAEGGGSSAGQGAAPSAPAPSEPAPTPDPQPTQPTTITVSVSVSSSAADGSVSGGASPTLNVGATAYDALLNTGLTVNASSGPYGIYVSAIGGLAEKQFGGNSGWNYSVNGVTPGTSSANYVLKQGDSVHWFYVV